MKLVLGGDPYPHYYANNRGMLFKVHPVKGMPRVVKCSSMLRMAHGWGLEHLRAYHESKRLAFYRVSRG